MQCTLDSCPKPAEYTFVWPWGTDGACCQGHVIVVQQKAKSARGKFGQVSFTRLNPDRPVIITRDERVELHSARLVAEAERDDAGKRAGELFEVNTKLANDVRASKLRGEQLQSQCHELVARVAALVSERDDALALASRRREEVEHDLMQQVEALVTGRTQTLEDRLQLSEEGRATTMRELERTRIEVTKQIDMATAAGARVAELERELARDRETPPEGVHPHVVE